MIIIYPDISIQLFLARIANAVNSHSLIAIPLFILTGEILNVFKLTDIIFDFAEQLVGHIKGGLAHVNVVASVILSGMSGSAVADAAGLGRIEIKAMSERGFGKAFSAVVTATSSTIGPIIPPSIPLVIYGVIAQESIGKLLIGGAIPGLIMASSLMLLIYIISIRREYTSNKFCGWHKLFVLSVKILPAIMAPVLLIGGMLTGIFTAVEASAVTVFYSIIIGFFYGRGRIDMSMKTVLWQTFKKVSFETARILYIVVSASLVGLIVTRTHLARQLVDFISGFTSEAWVVLLLINVVLLIAGCFLDATSCLILFTPILVPLVQSFGINTVHFGVVMVLNLMIGLITPPMGLSMYIVCDIANIKIKDFIREVKPFYIVLISVLLLITYVPGIVLWLSSLFIP